MATVKTLKDKSGNVVYPQTRLDCVYDSEGRNFQEAFNSKISKLPSSTVGNVPVLNAEGGIDDSEISVSSLGDMLKATYDPQGKAQDIFAYADNKANDKISKLTSPTAGNIPILTSDGQIEDSGKGVDEVGKNPLPEVTSSDAGKVLSVNVSGEWAAEEIVIPEITIDSTLSSTSTNPVQNKVINAALSGKASTETYILTLGTDWTDATDYVTQTVTVSGLQAADNPIIDLVTTEEFEAEQEAWGYVYRAVTAEGSITFYAAEATETAVNLQIKVVR